MDELPEELITDPLTEKLITNVLSGNSFDIARLWININNNKDKVKSINIKAKYIYIFDNDTKLWTNDTDSHRLENNVRNELINLFTNRLKNTDNMSNVDIKQHKKLLLRINTHMFLKSIINEIIYLQYDKTFKESLDNIADKLPIKNNKVINLRNGEIEDRTYEHKFTFECLVEYNDNTISVNQMFENICLN
jgi:hypothetical protein